VLTGGCMYASVYVRTCVCVCVWCAYVCVVRAQLDMEELRRRSCFEMMKALAATLKERKRHAGWVG
jgi:hypothetical protein